MAGWFNWNPDLEESGDYDPGEAAEDFASLTADADVELDEDKRDDLYSQAEELLLQNAVYVPLGTWTRCTSRSPGCKGPGREPGRAAFRSLFDQDVVVVGRE